MTDWEISLLFISCEKTDIPFVISLITQMKEKSFALKLILIKSTHLPNDPFQRHSSAA